VGAVVLAKLKLAAFGHGASHDDSFQAKMSLLPLSPPGHVSGLVPYHHSPDQYRYHRLRPTKANTPLIIIIIIIIIIPSSGA